MKKISLFIIAALAFAVFALPASADDGITVGSQNVSLDFPKTMTFALDASGAAEIRSVMLVVRFRDVTRRIQAKITPGKQVDAKIEWNLDTETSGNDGGYLPPGVTFNYTWVIEDAAGNKLETPSKSFTVTDNRISWQTVEDDTVAIHWYGADKPFGQAVFDSATSMIPTLREELGAEPTSQVNVWLYTDREDFRTSMPNMNEWTGGRSFGEYSSILLLISAFERQQTIQGVRHELTHQVIYDSLGSGLARTAFPHWMNEGLATYHEYDGEGLASLLNNPLQQAIRNDTLPRLRTLDAAFSPDSQEALLSYAMSYSVIEMMLQEYGEDKMREVFALFKKGTHAEEAFQKVYGTTTDGLDNQYRKSVGLPERELAQGGLPTAPAAPTFALSSAETPVPGGSATATPKSVSAVNTPAPAAATAVPQSGTTSDSGGAPTELCGVGLGGLALAMFGAYEWRKHRRPSRL
jgi:hypothetical protein